MNPKHYDMQPEARIINLVCLYIQLDTSLQFYCSVLHTPLFLRGKMDNIDILPPLTNTPKHNYRFKYTILVLLSVLFTQFNEYKAIAYG